MDLVHVRYVQDGCLKVRVVFRTCELAIVQRGASLVPRHSERRRELGEELEAPSDVS